MDAVILSDIVFDAPLEMFVERMRIQKRPSAIEELRELLEQAMPIARPKAMFKESLITDTGEDFVVIEGKTFYSRDLRQTFQR